MRRSFEHEFATPRHPERVVVLGARGFVGMALLGELSRANIPTLAISSSDIDLSSAQAGRALSDRLRPGDSVVFLSAINSGRLLDQASSDTNLAMGAAVCEAVAAAACQQIVYLSSDSVYPFQDAPITEATPAAATSLYSGMHLAREEMLNALDVPVAVLRATQVYGYGDTRNAYGPNQMSRSALAEGRIVLFGTGEDTRNHVYIDDLTAVLVEVLRRRSHGVLNVAADESESFAEIARLVSCLCPHSVMVEHADARMPVLHRHFDVAALRHAMPGLISTPLADGIARLLDIMQSNSLIYRGLEPAGR